MNHNLVEGGGGEIETTQIGDSRDITADPQPHVVVQLGHQHVEHMWRTNGPVGQVYFVANPTGIFNLALRAVMQSLAAESTRLCLSHTLEEDIHADITTNTASGTLRAHKALLTASSPVLKRMLLDDDREEKSSVIVIKDVSLEACGALLNYLYGVVRQEVFLKHPVALLTAAKKHDLADLKACCEESLLEDLTSGNVLERLREAWIHQLDRLKKSLLHLAL
ncbi:unnamed protein product [Spirodela intermedia]|uniref:BTB domain-containing protein n=1 Tax=Spirodela intermedia TaxID=51605 RepID=A0ABN7E935_SPIIN|nr:unnamed protein product [Spirodela intermedia]